MRDGSWLFGPKAFGRVIAASLAVASLAGLHIGTARAEPPVRETIDPAMQRPRAGSLRVESPVGTAGSVFLHWGGTIAPPMADQLASAYEAFKSSRSRVVLVMNSGGGNVAEGERVIALLQRIRRTHRLDTVVTRGGTCGSMCLPLYLQGETRFGARTSSWLFHEVTRAGSLPDTKKRVSGRYMQLIDLYWVPAGVSRAWIDRMLGFIDNHDYWQTGEELIRDNAGIITQVIENRTPRNLETEEMLMMPNEAKRTTVKSGIGLPAARP